MRNTSKKSRRPFNSLVPSLPVACWFILSSWFVGCVDSLVGKPVRRRLNGGDCHVHRTSTGSGGERDHDSLSHLLSSPERYAAIMGKTTREMQLIPQERTRAARSLHEALNHHHNHHWSGTERQFLVSQYRYQYGQHNFVCPTCWSYQPICLCTNITAMIMMSSNRTKLDIPFREIIVWTHPEEWGSPTNTGSLLPLLLQHTQLWMKGYHDQRMNEIVQDKNRPIVLLWPAPNRPHHPDTTASRASSRNQQQQEEEELILDQDKEGDHHELSHQNMRQYDPRCSPANVNNQMTLIAIEGTWRQARRMVSKLKKSRGDEQHNLFQLSIPIHEQGSKSDSSSSSFCSLLSPLRRKSRSMCTAEAVVAACQQGENLACHPEHTATTTTTTITVPILDNADTESESKGRTSQYDVILEWVHRKVHLTRRYQGKPLS